MPVANCTDDPVTYTTDIPGGPYHLEKRCFRDELELNKVVRFYYDQDEIEQSEVIRSLDVLVVLNKCNGEYFVNTIARHPG